MEPDDVIADLARLEGVVIKQSWGETSAFYNPGAQLPSGVYFATVKEKDGPNDRASNLGREGVWRLNIGVPRDRFEQRFGTPPQRPAKCCAIKGPWDFTALDTLTPHPIYGWMSWMAILSPSPASYSALAPLIAAAHAKAAAAFRRRTR